MDREQDPSKTPSLEERHKQLKDGQRKLVELAKTNSTIDHVKKELQEVKGVIREKRLDRGANGRWRRSESPRDPSPNVSDLAHSPPSPLSSNESSVDVYTAAEHKRPETIPPKILKDEVQVVQDSSDREDDPSSGDDAGKNEDAVQGPDGIQTLKSGAQQRMG